jgi:hypothetical protein
MLRCFRNLAGRPQVAPSPQPSAWAMPGCSPPLAVCPYQSVLSGPVLLRIQTRSGVPPEGSGPEWVLRKTPLLRPIPLLGRLLPTRPGEGPLHTWPKCPQRSQTRSSGLTDIHAAIVETEHFSGGPRGRPGGISHSSGTRPWRGSLQGMSLGGPFVAPDHVHDERGWLASRRTEGTQGFYGPAWA